MGRRPEINGRELLIAAALKLFAEQGIDAVSIRAVNREAGLGPASMHYHFGTKDALVDAVLRLHSAQIAEATTARAKQVAKRDVVNARDLVTMLAQPYLDLIGEQADGGLSWIRFAGQFSQAAPDRLLDAAATRAARAASARAYPRVAPKQRDRAVRMCLVLLVSQLAQTRAQPGTESPAMDLDLLIDFLSGGLDAAMGSSELEEMRSA